MRSSNLSTTWWTLCLTHDQRRLIWGYIFRGVTLFSCLELQRRQQEWVCWQNIVCRLHVIDSPSCSTLNFVVRNVFDLSSTVVKILHTTHINRWKAELSINTKTCPLAFHSIASITFEWYFTAIEIIFLNQTNNNILKKTQNKVNCLDKVMGHHDQVWQTPTMILWKSASKRCCCFDAVGGHYSKIQN